MERYAKVAEVDKVLGLRWADMGLREATFATAMDRTRRSREVGGRIPPDYVPPPQRSAPLGAPLSQNRKDMLDLVTKWYGTTLSKPRVPAGETKDLLAWAGWTKQMGVDSLKVRQDNEKNGTHTPIATSCGDVLAAMLRFWKSGFVGAFMIRDAPAPGAKARGYYVEATGANEPLPGDILVLRDGVGPEKAGTVGHVDILVSIEVRDGVTRWTTADGGAGALPDQSAQVTVRPVELTAKGIPILGSPTDLKKKQLDGWIDLDRVPREA